MTMHRAGPFVVVALAIGVTACGGGLTAPTATALPPSVPYPIPCQFVGTLPCQQPVPVPIAPTPPPTPVPTPTPTPPPVVTAPPPVIVAPTPTPVPTPSPIATEPLTCGQQADLVSFDPGSSLGKEYLWLIAHHGLNAASYRYWIAYRCANPGEAAVQDAQYASGV
jgi:hypothetical protein